MWQYFFGYNKYSSKYCKSKPFKWNFASNTIKYAFDWIWRYFNQPNAMHWFSGCTRNLLTCEPPTIDSCIYSNRWHVRWMRTSGATTEQSRQRNWFQGQWGRLWVRRRLWDAGIRCVRCADTREKVRRRRVERIAADLRADCERCSASRVFVECVCCCHFVRSFGADFAVHHRRWHSNSIQLQPIENGTRVRIGIYKFN